MPDLQLTNRVLRSVERRLEYLLSQCDVNPKRLQEEKARTDLEQMLSIHAHLTKIELDERIGVPTA